MKIEKTPGGTYRIADGTEAVEFDQERYEDLYYAVPVDTTAFYRLLTESVCETDDERTAMVAMLNALADMDGALKSLQDQIQALGV